MTTRRAMTLIEMLAATMLLSFVTLALSGWLGSSVRLAEAVNAQAPWRVTAMRCLRLIQDDLNIFDQPDPHDRSARSQSTPRARVAGTRLTIESRVSLMGPTKIEYLLIGPDLVRITQPDRGGARDQRIVLADIASLQLELNEEHRVLTVVLKSLATEQTVHRRMTW